MVSPADRDDASTSMRPSAGRVERWLTDSFERSGSRGVARPLMAVVIGGGLPWAVVSMIIGGLAGRMSRNRALWGAVINASAAAVGLGVAARVVFRDVATLEAWDAAGRPSAEASRILRLALTAPVRFANWGLGTYVLVALPTAFAWIIATVEPLAFAFLICVGGLLGATMVSWVLVLFVVELGHPSAGRPDLRRVSPRAGSCETRHVSAHQGTPPCPGGHLDDRHLRCGLGRVVRSTDRPGSEPPS